MMRKILIALAAFALAPLAALADIGQFQDKTFYTASSTGTGGQVLITWTPLQLVGVSTITAQFTSVGTGATGGFECSNDGGTTWLTCEQTYSNQTYLTTFPPVSGSVIYTTKVSGNSVRYRLVGLSSGTVTMIAVAQTVPPSISTTSPGTFQPNAASNATLYETASATGTTGVTTATLAAVASKTTFICGFAIASNATAATSGNATITGTITGTLNYTQGVGLSPAVSITQQTFTPCIPASAVNSSIVVNSIAAGTGGVTSVTAWGIVE